MFGSCVYVRMVNCMIYYSCKVKKVLPKKSPQRQKAGYIMPVSDAHTRASIEYAKKNLKRIPLDVQKEKYEKIAAAAEKAGIPVNRYIKNAIDEKMEREA